MQLPSDPAVPADEPMPAEIAAYFAAQSAPARTLLIALRQTIVRSAPDAGERISYKMPAFSFHGMLVWYGAFTSHIGLYPGAACISAFRDELTGYHAAKGSVRFPIGRPLPHDLVAAIVRFKVQQNAEKDRAPAKQRAT